MTRYSISVLGQAALHDEAGARLQFPSRALLLVAWLALDAPSFRSSRSTAAASIWRSGEIEAAAVNLRQLLARVRARQAELGMPLIHANLTHIWLDPSAASVDLLAFLDAIDDDQPVSAEELLDLYPGDLLASLSAAGGQGDGWIAAQRLRIRGAFLKVAEEAIATSQDSVAAAEVAHRMIDLDPHHEPAYRHLMQYYAAERQLIQVRDIYERCHRRLSEDLGVSPSMETTELLRRIFGSGIPALLEQPGSHSPLSGGQGAPFLPRITLLAPRGCSRDEQVAFRLVEDATIALCSLRTFAIVAPRPDWRAATERDPDSGIERFGIDFVVSSRMSGATGNRSIYISLFRTRSRDVIWAKRFELAAEPPGNDHQVVTGKIVHSLTREVDRALLDDALEDSPTAYQYYLRGQKLVTSLDLPTLRRARKEFKSAIAEAPGFTAAVAGLARTLHREWLLTARGDAELLRVAEVAARSAIATDGADFRGYRELARILLYRGDFDGALGSIETAERNGPNISDILTDHAIVLLHASFLDAAAAKFQEALLLNPVHPDEFWWCRAATDFFLKDFKAAVAGVGSMKDPRPAHRLLAACHAMLGDAQQAAHYAARTREVYPDFEVGAWMRIIPFRAEWQRNFYEAALKAAGFR